VFCPWGWSLPLRTSEHVERNWSGANSQLTRLGQSAPPSYLAPEQRCFPRGRYLAPRYAGLIGVAGCRPDESRSTPPSLSGSFAYQPHAGSDPKGTAPRLCWRPWSNDSAEFTFSDRLRSNAQTCLRSPSQKKTAQFESADNIFFLSTTRDGWQLHVLTASKGARCSDPQIRRHDVPWISEDTHRSVPGMARRGLRSTDAICPARQAPKSGGGSPKCTSRLPSARL